MKNVFPVRTLPAFLLFIIHGCVYHSLPDPAACEENPIAMMVTVNNNSDCGLQNGSFEIATTGGTGSYRYQLNNGEMQSGNTFVGLAAGNYTVTALDSWNCSASIVVSIKNKDGVNIETSFTEAGCETNNGSITATALGGVEPYTFKLSDREFQLAGNFENLATGEYVVTVRDATGCESSETVTIPSGVSFSQTIGLIIETKCAISGCHNGSQFPDLRTFETIRANAASIRSLTANRTMPATGSLTQAQIDQIACWVDDGAKNN